MQKIGLQTDIACDLPIHVFASKTNNQLTNSFNISRHVGGVATEKLPYPTSPARHKRNSSFPVGRLTGWLYV